MISKSRSSHKSPKRSRSRSREDDRRRRKDDRLDSRNPYRSDDRYRRDDRRRHESKEYSRSDRDRDRDRERRSSKYNRDHQSGGSSGRSRTERDSSNSRSSHRHHQRSHSDNRDGSSRESLDSNRHRSSESSRSDAHSRRPTAPHDLDGQSRIGLIPPSYQLPLVSNHLGTITRTPFINPTNSAPLIPNPLIMTPSMLAPSPSTSTLIPNNLASPVPTHMPRYYNPSTFNAAKYAIQEEKKKLLWGPANKNVSQQSNKVWQGLQFSGAQGQQMTEKFLKLMGSKPTSSSGQLDNADSMVKYQETLFEDLDKQYSAARMSTHINRGIGLGFSSRPNHTK